MMPFQKKDIKRDLATLTHKVIELSHDPLSSSEDIKAIIQGFASSMLKLDQTYGDIDLSDLDREYTVPEVRRLIDGTNMEDFDCLVKVDERQIDTPVCGVYTAIHTRTIWKHRSTNEYIGVEVSMRHTKAVAQLMSVYPVTRRESITYEKFPDA